MHRYFCMSLLECRCYGVTQASVLCCPPHYCDRAVVSSTTCMSNSAWQSKNRIVLCNADILNYAGAMKIDETT